LKKFSNSTVAGILIDRVYLLVLKKQTMGLLTPKGKKDGKKDAKANVAKNSNQGSKFMNKGVKSVAKKQMPGSAQRGS
jgi:hypothetical protein